MSHITGTLQILGSPLNIGPDAGLPTTTFHPDPPSTGGLKFVILHFTNGVLPANNRLEVDLGYATDVFTSADGTDFWTRPVNVSAFPGGNIPIRYITNGAANGGVRLVAYARGERRPGWQDPTALSNSDPFLTDATFAEPTYDPHWFCTPPTPNWENIRCEGNAADIKRVVAKSVGMIVHVYYESHVSAEVVSTCSVTLIAPDLIVFAGHCIEDNALEIGSASVIFNYETECSGTRPAGYSGVFYKVNKVVKHRFNNPAFPDYDYCILQLKTPPGGIPITPIAMRSDLPAVGEQLFGVHHPNGAVKKLSRPHPSYATVLSRSATSIRCNIDVSGGSSGSGIFDTSGRILGVCSNGGRCNLSYFPTASILQDVGATPAPSPARDVIIVFDRSGSMSLPAGTGKTKIQEARDAASLFVQLIRTGAGHRIGLVSFSTSSPMPPAAADFAVTAVTTAAKNSIIGPSPFSSGIVGGLVPGGNTTIGGGLKSALAYFPAPGANKRTILLLTDGLQNTPPMIDTVEPTLGGIDIDVIGFGTESSLDGTLLSRLSERHNGLYRRAGDPLNLKKFFAMAFGNIFESGTLADPEYFLPASQFSAPPVPFSVCGEEIVTAVVGWDNAASKLFIELITPAGTAITGGAGVEVATGNTWTFIRVHLPFNSERDGGWKVIVHRVGGGGEFPPPQVDLRYFLNIVVKGGPTLSYLGERKKYYTGDLFNPMLTLRYDDGGSLHDTSIKVTVTRPADSIGNILSKATLTNPSMLDADTIPARQTTLQELDNKAGAPVLKYINESFELLDDPANTGGLFEAHGILGFASKDILRTEGDYTFHAFAKYGHECISTRELIWSIHVDCGIDPTKTEVQTTVKETLPDGKQRVIVVYTPKDVYGNNLGPGRGGDFTVTGTGGSTVAEPVIDKGNGSYEVVVIYDPASGNQPGVVVAQPERPSVAISEPCKQPTEDSGKWKKWFYILLILLLVLLLIIIFMLLS